MPACRMFAAAAIVGMILATGADAEEPRISIGIASPQRLRDDLQYLVEMAPAPLNKQWKGLSATLESFEQGVNPDAPLRVDLIFAGQGLKFGAAIPIKKWDGRNGFLDNLSSFGFDVGKPNAAGLIEVKQQVANRGKKGAAAGPPAKPFYMRHLTGPKYGVLSSDAANIPANLPDPSIDLKAWLVAPIDIAAQLKNDTAGLKDRQASFSQMRKELEAAIEFKRTESEAAIELRKLALKQNLNEAERFLVESENLSITWTTDPAAKAARGDLALNALSGTSLHESIQLLCEKPSAFANVQFHPKPALQVRVNFPIDDLRSGHAKELYPKLLPVVLADIDARPALNDAGKAAGKTAMSVLFEMLTDSLSLKLLDTIVDFHATADGKHGLVCGIRTADGTKAVAALEQFPGIRENGWKFEKAVAEHGGVTIHAMTVAPHRMEEFRAICGGDPVVLIGVSKDIVWGAAGEGALEKLKTAIDQAAMPLPEKADPVFASLEMRVAPWIELLDVIRSKEPKPAAGDKTAQETERQRTKLRKAVKQAFEPADDVLQATIRREKDGVKGDMKAGLGIQRFIGTVIGFIHDEYFE
ncbi:MAG TPA: hypothetical protein VM165_23855 [Planctomycetaceae bacterium]|nr:hypothetical protein [Planctomycetaceae bacterium]